MSIRTDFSLIRLPWLPLATDEARLLLKATDPLQGSASVRVLRTLAQYSWPENDLGNLGRKVRKALEAVDVDHKTAAANSDLVPFSLLVISSTTYAHMADAFRANALRAGIALEIRFVEYEHPESWIVSNGRNLADNPPDATLLALDAKSLALTSPPGDFASADLAIQTATARIEEIADLLQRIAPGRIILQTIPIDADSPQSSLDAWLPGSRRSNTEAFNARLATLTRQRGFLLHDVASLAALIGQSQWYAGRYWYVAKYPFHPACIPIYCERFTRLLAASLGKSKRVLVLDLDNTLWSGIIGDDGLHGIVLGQGSAAGEAHLAIQRMALDFKDRGIILCVSSKNSEDVARAAIRSHPEMLIREDDITAFAIDWNDKAANIQNMALSLELGLESFVFLDDNPAERKRVRDALPMVAVPELPSDPAEWIPVIQAAAYFEQIGFSAEDKKRADFYKGNALRAIRAKSIPDHAQFLESLAMEMEIKPFDDLGLGRIAQLISKTNQFNLTTRRYSEPDLARMREGAEWQTMQIRLKDSFGDNGMVCVVICRRDSAEWDIDLWLMSCRVLGRKVENAVLAQLARQARAEGALRLTGLYIPSSKNALVRDLYEKLGFTKLSTEADGTTSWALDLATYQAPKLPIHVTASEPVSGRGNDAR